MTNVTRTEKRPRAARSTASRCFFTTALAFGLGYLFAGTTPLRAAKDTVVNAPAPELALRDASGQVHRLSDLRGQVVLIDFWASWCIPCKASFPQLDALHKEFTEKGFTVLAVNVDEQRRAADRFLAERTHTMPVLFDAAGASASAYDLKGMPSSVLVDRRGTIRYLHMGYTEKTLTQYRAQITQLIAERSE